MIETIEELLWKLYGGDCIAGRMCAVTGNFTTVVGDACDAWPIVQGFYMGFLQFVRSPVGWQVRLTESACDQIHRNYPDLRKGYPLDWGSLVPEKIRSLHSESAEFLHDRLMSEYN